MVTAEPWRKDLLACLPSMDKDTHKGGIAENPMRVSGVIVLAITEEVKATGQQTNEEFK